MIFMLQTYHALRRQILLLDQSGQQQDRRLPPVAGIDLSSYWSGWSFCLLFERVGRWDVIGGAVVKST